MFLTRNWFYHQDIQESELSKEMKFLRSIIIIIVYHILQMLTLLVKYVIHLFHIICKDFSHANQSCFVEMFIIIIIINSYTLVTSIRSTHEKLYATCIEWTKLSEVENRSQSIRLLHAVETVSFKTMYQICSRWSHVREWVF